jgi:hypothetical protein
LRLHVANQRRADVPYSDHLAIERHRRLIEQEARTGVTEQEAASGALAKRLVSGQTTMSRELALKARRLMIEGRNEKLLLV